MHARWNVIYPQHSGAPLVASVQCHASLARALRRARRGACGCRGASMRYALAAALCFLATQAAASYTPADFTSTSFVSRAPSAVRQAFWELAKTRNATELSNDSSLPPLPAPADTYRSVAVCITGGARGFPLKRLGIYDSIRKVRGRQASFSLAPHKRVLRTSSTRWARTRQTSTILWK